MLSIDLDSFSLNYTRVPGWPTEFPINLSDYTNLVKNSSHLSKIEKWKYEIAPWVWHYQGSAMPDPSINLEKAVILVLVRNSELVDIMNSVKQLENRYNHKYHYPYIFLNDVPFAKDFMDQITLATDSNITFSLIPSEHWSIPQSVDINQAKIGQEILNAKGISYAKSMSYRKMCRFNSGFFYKHPLLSELDFYWRLEPNVDFFCDLTYDPFKLMKQQDKKYSFVIILKELIQTIPTLWDHTLNFIKMNNIPISGKLLNMLVDSQGKYNLCHFWSNFEIASLKWFQSKEYNEYFDYLDSTGNFFYERWGDAPIHTLAAGLFLQKKDILFMNDIGYRHDNFARWPATNSSLKHNPKCQIPNLINNANNRKNPNEKIKLKNFDFNKYSCLNVWNTFEHDPLDWKYEAAGDPFKLLDFFGISKRNLNEFDHVREQKRYLGLLNGP
ncbi:O-glycoside alpha-1,2-mannosyltransferase omh1 [Smittium mucronatum]|uniref:O-glycoside alpha-1,2-mannosyltransferase omh1 n=1 Tax=Smittium mucronatum TaxID=133383 RepID=A0A1R0H9D9_9FUNG|nr:O-glycoside alpha-1,2-mannosyltransferase omh1 [Smittium mucronatum]